VVLLTGCVLSAHAQEPPVENPDQLSMLKSDDPKLARFDVFRIDDQGLTFGPLLSGNPA